MKNIVGIIQPFMFEQKLYVFNDQTLESKVSVPLNKVAETVVNLAYQEGITEVTLKGLHDFTAQQKKQIQESEASKYGVTKIHIDLA